MKTMNYLEAIVLRKQNEIDALVKTVKGNAEHPLNQILRQVHASEKKFSKALIGSQLSVIAEIKKKSPSLGDIREINDPGGLALEYCRGGASAISVLTDLEGFGGTLAHLQEVCLMLAKKFPHVAVIRKDFIIHPLQLAEAVMAGASAVLLIASILGSNLRPMIKEAARLGLESLTEVHDKKDLEIAIDAEAPIIGVNHRNLETFEMNLKRSEVLRPFIPKHVIAVAESGINNLEQAHRMKVLGYDAILVGEVLVRSENPTTLIKQMRGRKS